MVNASPPFFLAIPVAVQMSTFMLTPFKAAAVAGAGALLAYCVYFDRKRRSAPDYREKVTKRR